MTPMLTTPDVADIMRVTPATLRHMVAEGSFPEPFRRGRPWTWTPKDVADVLDGTWRPGRRCAIRSVA